MRIDRYAGAETSGLIPAGSLFQRVALNARALADETQTTRRPSTRRGAVTRKQSALSI